MTMKVYWKVCVSCIKLLRAKWGLNWELYFRSRSSKMTSAVEVTFRRDWRYACDLFFSSCSRFTLLALSSSIFESGFLAKSFLCLCSLGSLSWKNKLLNQKQANNNLHIKLSLKFSLLIMEQNVYTWSWSIYIKSW